MPDINLASKTWRLSNLYQVVDKAGDVVLFRPNEVQAQLYNDLHYLNVILKARQEGFTTFACIYFLDECLFNPHVEAGVIAHTKEDAMDIFRRKVQFPYEHLPSDIRAQRRLVTDSKSKMAFPNGSVLNVATSARSATLQYLLVSELGKIARKFPEKAREIMTGALESVGRGDTMVIVESTGEGRSGAFYDLCDQAQRRLQAGTPLTRMDYLFHFFPWYRCPDYRLADTVEITRDMQEYFAKVEAETRTVLNIQQRAWYIKKHALLGDDMKREYPSTPDEAFESGIEGTYFKSQFVRARQQKRITKVPWTDGVCVDTWWDLGVDDCTTIWFTQDIGREIHVINYYEASGEGLEFYRGVLDDMTTGLHYRYGRHVGPHDLAVKELGTGVTRLETARRLGMAMEVCPRIEHKMDAVQKVRSLFASCWFDSENCDRGLTLLEEYRKEWDEIHGVWKETPLHNDASHAADAFMTLACSHDWQARGAIVARVAVRKVIAAPSMGWSR